MKKLVKKFVIVFGIMVVALGFLGSGVTKQAQAQQERDMQDSFAAQSALEQELLYDDLLSEEQGTETIEEASAQTEETETEETENNEVEIKETTTQETEKKETETKEIDTKENESEETEEGSELTEKQSAASDTGMENETASETETARYKVGYIFMGDSRIYLMNEDCNIEGPANFFAVCCPGIGYEWMVSTALPEIRSIQSQHTEIESWVVISALGINDMQNINKYIASYKKLMKTSKLWLVSINPTVGRDDEPQYNNICINAFNRRLRKISGATYINTHDYLIKKGFDTKDGLHYTAASNWDIYSYMLKSLLVGKDAMPETDTDAKQLAQSYEYQLSQKK